jgi:hypothetical protein
VVLSFAAQENAKAKDSREVTVFNSDDYALLFPFDYSYSRDSIEYR